MSDQDQRPVLDIRDLTVGYRVGHTWLEAVRHVTMSIRPGETYGLVGESGSGKTTLALAILGYLPKAGSVRSGSIYFTGSDLTSLSREGMRARWGKDLAFVPQDPRSSLNPSLKIGDQLAEALKVHGRVTDHEVRQDATGLLEMVQIADPERVARAYPHEISGGMQQRVLIAMALCAEPKLLIMDEPTTGLDTTTQAAMLDLIRELTAEHSTATLYVTHNLGVVAQLCDRLGVLYAGDLVETGPTGDLFRQPLFPYTRALIDSVPKLGDNKRTVKLRPIDGRIPSLDDLPKGCPFRPRCPIAVEVCREYPPVYEPNEARSTRCHRWEEIQSGQVKASQPEAAGAGSTAVPRDGQGVLEIDHVSVHFRIGPSLMARLPWASHQLLKAVDDLSLDLFSGATLGLVGESGSGKTTLARAIVGLEKRTSGSMFLREHPLPPSLAERDRELLKHIQIVFQNPQEALNPYLTVGQTLRYPLERMVGLSSRDARRRAVELLRAVRLPEDFMGRLPAQLSGGEKQRVAVARAFASNPDVLVADEPVSSLDVSVQASILNLLNELQAEHESAYFFISHNLAVVGYLADVIAVIYLGRLMEVADAVELFEPPYHPYTEALLSAIPLIDPAAEQEQIRLEGEVPSPVEVPSGCPFHTRCPRFLGDICVEEEPPWQTAESGTRYFCHIPPDELIDVQEKPFRFDVSGTSE